MAQIICVPLGSARPNSYATEDDGADGAGDGPGRAMIDGKWSHIGRFKGPMLRDLASRAPYFHNGFAADGPEIGAERCAPSPG